MKRYVTLALILLAGAAGVVFVQRERVSTRPSPEALLMAAADAQHELTRVPARLDRMTDAEEIAMGKNMASHVSSNLGRTHADPSHDAAIQDYLQSLGTRVAAKTHRRLPWTFHYIPSPGFVNAFALPGGQVFVGEGLIRLMGSEDALAAVLGHEVEHIDLGHCAERAQTDARIRQLGVLGDIAGFPMEIFMAGYSKEQELEADRNGTTLAVQAGYSYTGILQLFDSFTRLETQGLGTPTKSSDPVSEAAQLSLATLSGYFASHPPSSQRSETIRELASQRGWPAKSTRPLLRQELLPLTENKVLGLSPAFPSTT
jgi:predicted Zn-dependent protease